jgi:hypothetical protein
VAGKVSGPGGGPPIGGPKDDQKSEGPSGTGGARFADKLGATDPTRKTGQTGTPGAASAARGPTADVAKELTAGRIDAKAAIDKVIQRVLDKQVGPGAPAAVREKVRAALESAIADDPLLSEKIKALGG